MTDPNLWFNTVQQNQYYQTAKSHVNLESTEFITGLGSGLVLGSALGFRNLLLIGLGGALYFNYMYGGSPTS